MSLRFFLCLSSPKSAAERAYAFAQELIEQGHCIECVFISDAAVQLANDSTQAKQWVQFSRTHTVPLVLCSQAAATHQVQPSDLLKPFEIDSLMRLL
ncbi:MAG: DsrE family protein, partial [Pseudomonadota bacterium]